ncbi:MAG: ATP-binding protein [Mastigocoleus sp. MO_167.B18]|nr:ATP-binding protein [Mastigocoleus sp. MO_167.B18]
MSKNYCSLAANSELLDVINSLQKLLDKKTLQLEQTHEQLEQEKAKRQRVQSTLEKVNENLQSLVEERTTQLTQANEQLSKDLKKRLRVEKALRQTLEILQETQLKLIQNEKMASLGQLVAGIAHEINNPVNFIHGNVIHAQNYAQELLELVQIYQEEYPEPNITIQEEMEAIDFEFLQQDICQLLQSMRVGTERIRELVKSLRIFSRFDEAEFKPVDIHEGIESTLMMLKHRLKGTVNNCGIKVIKEYANLPLLQCYPGQLNQVFMNLLVNSIDALDEYNQQIKLENIPAKPSQIRIKTEVIDNQWVKICIQDNGSGIPEEVQSKIFDPFFSTKPIGKGTGLGLSISYQIVVEKHQGKLICNSKPGKGTEFAIYIPLHLNFTP